MGRTLALAVVVLLTAATVDAGPIDVFEGDPAGWIAAAGTTVLIDFDDVVLADATFVIPTGTEYAGLPGGPMFIPTSSAAREINSTLAIINPGAGLYGTSFFPVSGANVFAPDADDRQTAPQGVVTVTFSQPATAFSAWFLDVESGFAFTGFDLDGTNSVVDFAFTSAPGDDTQAFLGIVSTVPFTSLNIHFATSAEVLGSDGVALDDIRYALAPVPEPSTWLLLALGAASVAWRRRKRAA